MDNIRKTLHIAGNNFKKWKTNPRYYVILLFLLGYINMMVSPIRAFCQETGYNIHPYVFPFFLAEPYSLLMVLLGLILLFCDAPFIEDGHPYIIMRSGRKVWTCGQLVYIALASLAYFAIVLFLTVVSLLPYLTFATGWGKVINTLTQTSSSWYQIPIPFDRSIVERLKPGQAFLIELFLCWLLGTALGYLMFIVNMRIGRNGGPIIAAAVAVFPLVVRRSDWWLHYVSPASWVSLSVLNLSGSTTFPSFSYAVLALTIIIIAFASIAAASMAHRDVDILKTL